MANDTFDYVIVGGGTAGCVLAERLGRDDATVALLEAGPEQYDEMVMNPAKILALSSTAVVEKLETVEQPHLNNRKIPQHAGRILSGSSAVNYGNWTRCDSADYDEFAHLVGDQRWSYEALLPYFKQTETHYGHHSSQDIHGFAGPIHTSRAADRKYPLQSNIHDAFQEAGLPEIADINSGKPVGFGPFVENWRDARRQPAGKVFNPTKATVLTETTVNRILIDVDGEVKTASGVELASGEVIKASKEVILCAGSLGTPKLLMLSGVGPAEHLASFGVPVLQDLPVGENLHDHLSATLFWKLRNPEQGLSIGHPNFNKPEYFAGNPIEWMATMPIDDIQSVAKAHNIAEDDSWVQSDRAHVEMFAAYAPLGGPRVFGEHFREIIGTHISTPVLGLKPRSRGSVKLASSDPSDTLIIDSNYLSDPVDREAFRTGVRCMMRAFLDTSAGKELISGETPPPNMPKLSLGCTDEEIDARVEEVGSSFFQMAGTASMGKVVDTSLRVKGIERLRVVDASIIPVPLAGHYQCPVYAMAQLAGDLIVGAA